MAVSMSASGFESVESLLDPGKFMREVAEVTESALQEGQKEMREMIGSRGTGKTWVKPWGKSERTASIPGRVDTGQMQRDAKGEIESKTADTVVGSLGWKNGSPVYMRAQEGGFRHNITGEDVSGMFALRDSGEAMRKKLVSELGGIVAEL